MNGIQRVDRGDEAMQTIRVDRIWRVRRKCSALFLLLSAAACSSNSAGPDPAASSLTLSSPNVVGGVEVQGKVTLMPAPAAEVTVTLTSSNSQVAAVQSQVKVPAGQTEVSFAVSTSPVAASTEVTITGTYNINGATTTKDARVRVNPPVVSSIAVDPSPVVGGGVITVTVRLSGNAPAGGAGVTLSTNDSTGVLVGFPSTVTIPAGSSSATFTATTRIVTAQVAVSITAASGGASASASLPIQIQGGVFVVLDATPQLATGLDMFVDTDRHLTTWVFQVTGEGFRASYPAGQDFGFAAIYDRTGGTASGTRAGRDLSAYRSLVVEMRGESGGEQVDVGIKDTTNLDDGNEVKVTVNLTAAWQTLTFPLTTFSRSDPRRVYIPFEVVFVGRNPRTIFFRNVRYVP
jgi:hypothetical protein